MRTFTNELKNEICIEVTAKVIDSVDGVYIKIIGPDSTSENHITREEAQILLEELSNVLK